VTIPWNTPADLTDDQLADCLLMCNAGFIPPRNAIVEAAKRLQARSGTTTPTDPPVTPPKATASAQASQPPSTGNAARCKRYRIRRATARAGLGRTLPKWMQRVAYFGWRCRYCEEQLSPQTLTIDHQIPVSRGGTDHPANLVPACRPCNSAKRDQTPAEFLARGGRL
jgi:5-methylcytosine-specific restriction endonuclease McrA